MFNFLRRRIARWRISRTVGLLERKFRNSPGYVEIDLENITLGSLNPQKQLTGPYGESHFSLWNGDAHFPFWGDSLHLSFHVTAPRPNEAHLAMIREMVAHADSMRVEIDDAILNHYQADVFLPGATDLNDDPLPKITYAHQLNNVIEKPSVHPDFEEDNLSNVPFELHFPCVWDDYNGLKVRIADWTVQRVGSWP